MNSAGIGQAPRWARTVFVLLAMVFMIPLISACATSTDAGTSTKFDAASDQAIVLLGTNVQWFEGYVGVGESLTTYWLEYDPDKMRLVPEGKTFWTAVNNGVWSKTDYRRPSMKVMEVEPGDYALVGAGFPRSKALFVRTKDGSRHIEANTYYVDPRKYIDPQAPVNTRENFLFSVAPGQVVYIGSFEFVKPHQLVDMIIGIGYSQDLSAAREALKDYPGISGPIIPLDLRIATETAAR